MALLMLIRVSTCESFLLLLLPLHIHAAALPALPSSRALLEQKAHDKYGVYLLLITAIAGGGLRFIRYMR